MTESPALVEPTRPLEAFPAVELPAGRQVARSHSVAFAPWWFASAPTSGGGRFDLAAPLGTCYVADTIEAAVRERLRDAIMTAGIVSPRLADAFAVSLFATPRAYHCAHIGLSRAARFGVTRELASLTPSHYHLSRTWAAAFQQAGFEAIRYGARFTPGPANAWALFGAAGARERPRPVIDHALTGREACRLSGVRVVPPPRLSSLTVLGS